MHSALHYLFGYGMGNMDYITNFGLYFLFLTCKSGSKDRPERRGHMPMINFKKTLMEKPQFKKKE